MTPWPRTRGLGSNPAAGGAADPQVGAEPKGGSDPAGSDPGGSDPAGSDPTSDHAGETEIAAGVDA